VTLLFTQKLFRLCKYNWLKNSNSHWLFAKLSQHTSLTNLVLRGDRKDRIVYFSCAWLRLENRYKNKTYTQIESERKAKKKWGGNLISGCPSWGAGFAVTRVSGKPMGSKLMAVFFFWLIVECRERKEEEGRGALRMINGEEGNFTTPQEVAGIAGNQSWSSFY